MRIASYAFAFMVFLASAAHAESVMVNNKESKIRSGPATGYTVLWRPRMYTPFEVLAKYETWYAVRDVEGDVGWIHDSGIGKDAAAIVTAEIISVYESADTNSRVLYQAPKNYTFKIAESKEGWHKVLDPDGETGWIADKGIWKGEKQAEKKAKPRPTKKPIKNRKKRAKGNRRRNPPSTPNPKKPIKRKAINNGVSKNTVCLSF